MSTITVDLQSCNDNIRLNPPTSEEGNIKDLAAHVTDLGDYVGSFAHDLEEYFREIRHRLEPVLHLVDQIRDLDDPVAAGAFVLRDAVLENRFIDEAVASLKGVSNSLQSEVVQELTITQEMIEDAAHLLNETIEGTARLDPEIGRPNINIVLDLIVGLRTAVARLHKKLGGSGCSSIESIEAIVLPAKKGRFMALRALLPKSASDPKSTG